MSEQLRERGVQTVGIIASRADRARLYFRFRPARFPIGADPDLATHRAFGLPNSLITPELWQAVESKTVTLAQELGLDTSGSRAFERIDELDDFTPTESDRAESRRHQAQFIGQFLVDREGIVRWANVECQRDGLAGLDAFPTGEELLDAARSLQR